jgi:hypothetical protein
MIALPFEDPLAAAGQGDEEALMSSSPQRPATMRNGKGGFRGRRYRRKLAFVLAGALWIAATGSLNLARADSKEKKSLNGRVVASGIPGASAISAVGTFLPGGPIHDNPVLAAYTQPGSVLDPARIVVGSTSNFGAPVANADQLEGSFLSIDPRGADVLKVPASFASAGDQASTLGGRVQMYSAQSPAFRNGINTPSAVTANFTAVANPLGMSINNAFGRLWPANAPYGLEGIGTSTIVDPNGVPLAGAPNQQTGGVYAGNLTPRQPTQVLPGALNTGAVGTAFLGRSPDGSGRAVFAVVTADGGLVQEHTAQALDGLAPPATVGPLIGQGNGGVSPRLGAVLNYEPIRILYVSEPFENSIAAIELTDDGVIFRVVGVSRLNAEELDKPIDLAPAEIETSDPDWASNTTLEEEADFYVANRGNNKIVRMRQDGTVAAVRRVRLADGRSLGHARINGIATSPDASTIWVTVTGRLPGPGQQRNAVLELAAFGD